MNTIKALKKLAAQLANFDPIKTTWVVIDTPICTHTYVKRGNQWYFLYQEDDHVSEGKKVTSDEVQEAIESEEGTNALITYGDDPLEAYDHPNIYTVGEKETILVSAEEILDGIDKGFKNWVKEVEEETKIDREETKEIDYYVPSDYEERMEERRQMGLSNF